MKHASLFWIGLFAVVLGTFVEIPKVFSQASVNVSTEDPVYRDIDKLVGHGLVDKIIMGQRPFSRREIARITGEALVNFKKLEAQVDNTSWSESKRQKLKARMDYLTPILLRLKKQYREELVQLGFLKGKTKWYSVHLLENVDTDVTLVDSPPRGIPFNGIAFANDAIINPLINYRQGRNLVDGSNLSVETSHWLRASDYFAFYAQPRFQLAIGRPGIPDQNKAFAQNLYGKLFFKNFEIEVGRDQVFYGQGYNAGLLLSNNPRGLDMIKISNDIPFYLPWVFRYMGAHKMSFFFADLGPEQNFPNAYLVGYKWSLQPLSFFELGFSVTTQGGGEGSPPASFGERAKDILPINQETQIEISNKFAGFDFRFRVPPARGLEIYGEWIADDMDKRRLGSIFKEDSGYVAGVYLPRVTNDGRVDLRLEYHRTGIRFYRHSQFTSGYVLNSNIIGDNLGPDGNAGYFWVNWDINQENLIEFHGAVEWRSNDQYIAFGEPNFRFEKVTVLPKEQRYRMMNSWQHRMKDLPLSFLLQLGYERVENFNFVEGSNLNNWIGRFFVRVNLDGKTSFGGIRP